MRVSELIDILREQDPNAEVEMAVIAPVDDAADEITVDRYTVEGVLPWNNEDDDDDESEGVSIWLVGGDEGDVEAFLDAIDAETDELDPLDPPDAVDAVDAVEGAATNAEADTGKE